MSAAMQTYRERVDACLDALGIARDLIDRRGFPLQLEAVDLEIVAVDQGGRQHRLAPAATRAWKAMHAAAAADGISLVIVSGFRSVERQAEIIRGKLAAGLPREAILRASAPPGYSEHHTGRAIDLTTTGVRPLEEEFETTAAFSWLSTRAPVFGFTLSYPRDNRHGFLYEPWHWCFGRR
jgi:zinc D-Ala-D-Ala carboxypeptidase